MKITVIVPAYNAESHLAMALNSVFAQTRPADDVILVDDCSTDQTRNVALRHRVKLLSTGVNSGHAAARNVAIEAATGDVIAWLDADDHWEPDHLAIVCGLLERHSEAAVAFSGVRCFGDREKIWSGFPCTGRPAPMFQACLAKTIVPAMSAVTRTDAIRAVGGFDPTIRVAPDFDLWLRMSRRYPFVSTDEVTANRRYHQAQITAVPIHQLVSMSRTRFRMAALLRESQQEPYDLPATVVERFAISRLERDLVRLWKGGKLDDFKVLAAFARSVPLRNRTRLILGRQRAAEIVLQAWDRLTSNQA